MSHRAVHSVCKVWSSPRLRNARLRAVKVVTRFLQLHSLISLYSLTPTPASHHTRLLPQSVSRLLGCSWAAQRKMTASHVVTVVTAYFHPLLVLPPTPVQCIRLYAPAAALCTRLLGWAAHHS